MAQELFQAVRTAEETADQLVQDAQLKAREMIKAAEARNQGRRTQGCAFSARAIPEPFWKINGWPSKNGWRSSVRRCYKAQQESLDAARQKLDKVAQMIFERVWNDGNR